MVRKMAPKLAQATLDPQVHALVTRAKKLFADKLSFFAIKHRPPAYIVKAPGRVNLIGEHTDYTGGFVLPMAINRHTVIYGTGVLHTGRGSGPTTVKLKCCSEGVNEGLVEERQLSKISEPPHEEAPRTWVNYVEGVVAQYLCDLPGEGCQVELVMAITSDIPLGAGLSSSAALEVATASFLECILCDYAYSSVEGGVSAEDIPVERAQRCKIAENEWARSPCGIMDQLIVSAAKPGHFLNIDCRSYEMQHIPMKKKPDTPVVLICNSTVQHSIGDSEYGKRRAECHDAVEAMAEVPLYHVETLRDATLADLETTRDKISSMDETIFKRARHVVTENTRTAEAKLSLKIGVWERVGELMNASHKSLQQDYEVSCAEIDVLVDIAQAYDGVYGSRVTGGGFGGCTVSLVAPEAVEGLVEKLKTDYKGMMEKDCECFVSSPVGGTELVAIDMESWQSSSAKWKSAGKLALLQSKQAAAKSAAG